MKSPAAHPRRPTPAAASAAGDRAQAQAGLARCLQQQRAGLWAQVVDEAPAVLEALVAAGLAAEREDLLHVLALCACEVGRFDVSLEAAQSLATAIGPPPSAGKALRAAFVLGACLERMGDSWQAERVLNEALMAADEAAPARDRMVLLNGLTATTIGAFHRLRGLESEAHCSAVLERARQHANQARALLALAPDRVYQVTIGGNLGEVLTHLGELAPAWELLSEARSLALAEGLPAHSWRIECSLGEWWLASGQAAQALDAMLALLAQLGQLGDKAPLQTVIRAHQAAYRASRALGRFEQALAHLETAEQLERRRVTQQLRAQSQLFVTRSEAEHARRDAQHHRRRANEFAEDAERDMLTGLGNRRLLARRFAELMPVAVREGRPLAVAALDVDHFKTINDRFGHAGGDRVLVALAQLLRENTRVGDVLVRHGGEEFVIVLPGMALACAAEACERLRERIAAHDWIEVLGSSLSISASIGLAVSPPYDAQTLLDLADAALYRAKHGGRNRVCSA